MPSATTVLPIIETALLGAALCALARGRAYKRFPAFCAYLTCRLSIYAVLNILLFAARLALFEKHVAYAAYYYVYWGGYLLGAGIAFLVLQEIFAHLMEPLPTVGRFGLMAFRWVALISILIALAMTIFPAGLNQNLVIATTGAVMRCASFLELCLLAFIVLSMQTLRLSPRNRDFGIALGLAMVAVAELFTSAFAFGHATAASISNSCCQIVVTLAAAVWLGYFVKAETQVVLVAARSSSILTRWNEVIAAFDEPPTQVAITSSGDFFLQDVEKAVDKVLGNNSGRPLG